MTEDEQREIEQVFIASWDLMDQFYNDLAREDHAVRFGSMVELIAEFRQRGYDRQFRAGKSLTSFILSRAREDGLRGGQPRLRIELELEGGIHVWYYESPNVNTEFKVERVEITPELDDLLRQLLAQPID